jgi:glycosyltransferase involved in cell wall biosynthesis/2-polyprenyl-3-methyl-5-hydroxy-6-metoxy-1,4-benzoquinol methylase
MPKVIYGPVKVLELIHNPRVTGPGRIVLGLAKYAQREEFRVDVLCPGNGFLPDELKMMNVRVIPLLSWSIFREPGEFFRLRKILAREKFHVFNIHSGQLNAFGKIMALSLGIPGVISTEHLAVGDHRWIKNKFILAAHFSLHRLSNLLADRVIAVSEAARAAFIDRQGEDPRKVDMVYNGIDLQEARGISAENIGRIKERWMIPADVPVLAVVGRLSPEKGQSVFVQAAKELLKDFPSARFMIVGAGPERGRLEKMIDESGLEENFILTGFIKNIDEAFGVADVVIQPSFEEGESFGLTVAEAMSRGKPVVVSDIGCFKEIVRDGANGLLFSAGDHMALAAKARLLLGDAPLRKTLGAEGRKTIEAGFDIRIMCRKTEVVYKDVLRRKGFMIYRDHIGRVEAGFIAHIEKEGSLTGEKSRGCGESAKDLLAFIYGRKRGPEEIRDYVAREHMFRIEKFLEFIEKDKPFLEPASRYNLRSIKRLIKNIPVSPKDYDARVELQSEQFQIDNYYEPKDPALKARVDCILGFVRPQKGERILDLGCGVGTFAFHCAKRGAVCCGADYSQSSLDMAGRLVGRFGLAQSVEFRCCDISNGLPYADHSFDKIVSADFIEHIDRAQKIKFVSELRRLLKPQGQAVVFTPNLLREQLGAFKAQLTGLFGGPVSETRLHFGLTDRFAFEKLLKKEGFVFKRFFLDADHPYFARIPVLNEILSLNLLWVIHMDKHDD